MWKSAKVELPPKRKQVLILVESGYMAPYSQSIQTAHYDPEYRPRSPWLTDSGDSIEEYYGDVFVFWREIPEGWLGKRSP